MTPEHEITRRLSLTDARGRLNPHAVGWMREPLLDTSGVGGRRGWGRNKRWEYWGVMTPTHVLAATISSIDYAGVHEVWVLDRESGTEFGHSAVVPLARGTVLPPSLGEGPARAAAGGLDIEITDEGDGATRLRASAPRVRFDVLASTPPGHEALGVVVPWSGTRFQYTVKDVGRPASGTVHVDGVAHDVPAESSWAVLDHGRGRWPYDVRWNWGAAAGVHDGQEIALQLGGQWTVGTGSTENAVLVNGRLHKIGQELRWEYDREDLLAPWSITGTALELTFTPFHHKASRTNLGVVSTRTDQCFGTYGGWFRTEAGDVIGFERLEGWAEDVHNRW